MFELCSFQDSTDSLDFIIEKKFKPIVFELPKMVVRELSEVTLNDVDETRWSLGCILEESGTSFCW